MSYPKTIWTIREQLENGHAVAKWCPTCRKALPDLDLAGAVAAGYGDVAPRDLPMKCPTCKTRVQITIVPWKGEKKAVPPNSGGPQSPSLGAF
jgi:hypothetical protein